MTSFSHSAATFSVPASDLLRSSGNGVSGVPLIAPGKACFGTKRQEFSVVARIRKVKKHEYPWSDDPDPHVKGGVLSHLSHFKPLKEKPKPVSLDFERPLFDLEKKIIDVRKMADETGLDFSDQILSLEKKYQQALKDLYTHLTPIQRVQIARHPNRPTFLDHVFSITEKFMELHGDRAGYDDPAIVTGIGSIDGRTYMFIGHQKGRNTKENIQRNFGMPTPHGYRKALRMMNYADHHGFPIVTFIDTPGAYADLKSEELGQGEAIAHNLRTMFGLKVPVISIVIGEGGSGGALAIACANKLIMLENAVFYVASPEACAAILWKSSKAAAKAAEKLKITAEELLKLDIADSIIPEPLGGAHADPSWTSHQIKIAISSAMDELMKMDTEELLKHRSQKFRKIGGFQEGVPIDPKRKFNMKKREVPIHQKGELYHIKLGDEVQKLKQQILEAHDSSAKLPDLGLNEMLEKLRREVDHELLVATKAMGLKDSLVTLRAEISKARSSDGRHFDPTLNEKITKLNDEIHRGLYAAPNIASLNSKLNMLKELTTAKNISEKGHKAETLELEINKKFKELMDRPDLKVKIEALKREIENSGASQAEDLDRTLKENIMMLNEEVELEFANALKSLGLDILHAESKAKMPSEQTSIRDFEVKIKELNDEIEKRIKCVANSSDVKNRIDLLKLEAASAGVMGSMESKNRVEHLEQQIKQLIVDALNSSSPDLMEKYEKLKAEMSEYRGLHGSLTEGHPAEGSISDISAQQSVA